MRILVFSASYHPVLGGLQTAVQALAAEWQATGHDIQIITQRYPRRLPAYEKIDGLSVWRRLFLTPEWRYIRYGRPDLFLTGWYYYYTTQTWLDRKMQEFQPDVVNLHFPDAQIPFVLKLRERYKFRLVVSLHGHDVERWFQDDNVAKPDKQPKSLQLRQVLQSADFITTCSSYLLKRSICLEAAIRHKGINIPNGVNLARFQDHTPYNHSRPYILAFGRLTKKKGFDLLLQSLATQSQRNKEYDLLLAGDGELSSALYIQAERLGFRERVKLLGRITPEQIVHLLNGCLALVIPSREEPFGIVALEGLAAGKPVLATHVGGLPEILAGSSNRLVEPTIDGIVSGLNWLEDDVNWSSLAQKNRRLAASYTWTKAAHKYISVFQRPNK